MDLHSDSLLDLLEVFLAENDSASREEFEEWILTVPGPIEELRAAWERWSEAHEALELPLAARAVRSESFRPGQEIGPFRLVRPLGRGGQAVVWEADHRATARRVALKLQRPDRSTGRAGAHFTQEAEAAARLRHAGVAAIHCAGRDGALSWISQELVAGGRTLRSRIDEVRSAGGAGPEWYREAARLVGSIAHALQAAHDSGVVHRDVKPQNILLTDMGTPKVIDFGLALVDGEAAPELGDQRAGTHLYMSPEQVEGRSDLDHRTDVFSLGVVLYELLTLERPFQGETVREILGRILRSDPRPPPQVPRELSRICSRALEKDRRERYSSMAALAADLQRFSSHHASRRMWRQGPMPMVRRMYSEYPGKLAVSACSSRIAARA